jgi:hypothetical protein
MHCLLDVVKQTSYGRLSECCTDERKVVSFELFYVVMLSKALACNSVRIQLK